MGMRAIRRFAPTLLSRQVSAPEGEWSPMRSFLRRSPSGGVRVAVRCSAEVRSGDPVGMPGWTLHQLDPVAVGVGKPLLSRSNAPLRSGHYRPWEAGVPASSIPVEKVVWEGLSKQVTAEPPTPAQALLPLRT